MATHRSSGKPGCKQNGQVICKKCNNKKQCNDRYCVQEIYRMDELNNSRLRKTGNRKMFRNIKEIGTPPSENKQCFQGTVTPQCSTTNLSRKPVNCPFPGCEKNIAVSAVDAHFKYEHKFVAFINTFFDKRIGFEFNPFLVKCNENHCIALLNILDELGEQPKFISRNCFNSLQSDINPRPMVLAMATRVPYYQLYGCQQLEEEDHNIAEDYEMCNSGSDKIILWVASNVVTKLKYTMAISTSCKAIRLKYFGTVPHLNEQSIRLCEHGEGLILNNLHILGMTDNATNPLRMDIMLHKGEIDQILNSPVDTK